MKTFFQLREELTMMTDDGEKTHVIHNMKHTSANAKKVRNAVGKAAAKHAGASHSDLDDYFGDDHHYKADEAHKSSKPASGIVHHKTMDDYVKHHAKKDSKLYKRSVNAPWRR